MKQAALDSPLDEWDYAVLETVRRDDYSAPLKFGTVRTSEALLKLYCHGMIRRMEREPTFDEQERVQAWMDSAAFKQYADRLKRMMTGKVKARLEMISRILGVDGKSDMLELTDAGSEAVNAKRAEMAAIYEDMDKRHAADGAKFYKDAQSYERFLPTLLAMGFAGAATGAVLASAGAQYSGRGNYAGGPGDTSMDNLDVCGDFDAGEFGLGG